VAVAEDRLKRNQREIEQFRVHPQYRDMEAEADDLTRRLGDLANENTIDLAAVRDLESAMESEAPPELINLQSVYKEAGIALPGLVNRRYEDVRRFHESVVRNRKDYLKSELVAARSRIQSRNQEKADTVFCRSSRLKIYEPTVKRAFSVGICLVGRIISLPLRSQKQHICQKSMRVLRE